MLNNKRKLRDYTKLSLPIFNKHFNQIEQEMITLGYFKKQGIPLEQDC